jgi:hypothetical protein
VHYDKLHPKASIQLKAFDGSLNRAAQCFLLFIAFTTSFNAKVAAECGVSTSLP